MQTACDTNGLTLTHTLHTECLLVLKLVFVFTRDGNLAFTLLSIVPQQALGLPSQLQTSNNKRVGYKDGSHAPSQKRIAPKDWGPFRCLLLQSSAKVQASSSDVAPSLDLTHSSYTIDPRLEGTSPPCTLLV